MAKVVGIIKDDPITGVEYGIIEVPDTETQIQSAVAKYQQATRTQQNIKKYKNNTRQK